MILHSFDSLVPTFDMVVRAETQNLMRWATQPEYRQHKTRSNQVVHWRYYNRTVQQLDQYVNRIKDPAVADAVRSSPEYRACKLYLCDTRTREGELVEVA